MNVKAKITESVDSPFSQLVIDFVYFIISF